MCVRISRIGVKYIRKSIHCIFMCNLKKNTFSPRHKTYQTFSLVLLLLFLFQASCVVCCVYKLFGGRVQLPQWWLQIKIGLRFRWKLSDLPEITFFSSWFVFFCLPQSCHMAASEQVACYSAFLCLDAIYIRKNIERTSDGNVFSEGSCKT